VSTDPKTVNHSSHKSLGYKCTEGELGGERKQRLLHKKKKTTQKKNQPTKKGATNPQKKKKTVRFEVKSGPPARRREGFQNKIQLGLGLKKRVLELFYAVEPSRGWNGNQRSLKLMEEGTLKDKVREGKAIRSRKYIRGGGGEVVFRIVSEESFSYQI